MKYVLVTHYKTEHLATMVNDYLAKGWKLYGSPIITSKESRDMEYGQAVTFEEEVKTKS